MALRFIFNERLLSFSAEKLPSSHSVPPDRSEQEKNPERSQQESTIDVDATKRQPNPLATAREKLEKADQLSKIDQRLSYFGDSADQMYQNKIEKYLFEHAHIPKGNFIYSRELRQVCFQRAHELKSTLNRLDKATESDNRERITATFLGQLPLYGEDILQQFLKDNIPHERYETFKSGRFERAGEAMNLTPFAKQIEVVKYLAQGDENGALEAARSFIRFTLNVPDDGLDQRTENVIQELAKVNVNYVRERVYPIVVQKISDFAERGMWHSFWDRAKSTARFFGDWVATPFSDNARDRMANSMLPLAVLQYHGGYDQLGPILRDFASTAFHVSLNNGQLLELMESLEGVALFEATTFLTTMGAGSALKGAQVSGTALNALRAATMTASAGKTLLRPSYGVSNAAALSYHEFVEKMSDGGSGQ